MDIFDKTAKAERIVSKLKKKTGLLFLPCWKFADFDIKKPVVLLLDSGANENIISSEFVIKLDIWHDIDKDVEIMGLGKTNSGCSLTDISFELGGNLLCKADFLVIDNLDCLDYVSSISGYDMVGILGTSFLDKYGFILDFNEQTIKYGYGD